MRNIPPIAADAANEFSDAERRLRERAELRGAILSQRSPITPNRVAAAIVWLAGAVSTYLFISGLLRDMPSWLAAAIAVGVQVVLTVGERGITRGRITYASAIALVFDALLNAGGLYQPMQRLGATSVGQMLADVTGRSADAGGVVTFAVCLLLGIFIALAPEELWRRKD